MKITIEATVKRKIKLDAKDQADAQRQADNFKRELESECPWSDAEVSVGITFVEFNW